MSTDTRSMPSSGGWLVGEFFLWSMGGPFVYVGRASATGQESHACSKFAQGDTTICISLIVVSDSENRTLCVAITTGGWLVAGALYLQ